MVWVTSTYEAELLRGEAVGPKVEVVPMIHAVRADVPPFGPRRNILFIGGFRHPPNEDAVIYFVEEVLPLVRSELPGVQFLIVGSHVPPSILKLASADVIVLGYVQDVEPIFDSCRVSVAPIRYGAGVKGKVTHSLAWGLPAVATPVAEKGDEWGVGRRPGELEWAGRRNPC
jgi:glycosyltransferase involved in cell wall biosynthesis